MKNKPKLIQWDLIEVTWEDTLHTNGWQWLNEFDWDRIGKQLIHRSVGYVVYISSEILSICQTMRTVAAKDGDWSIDEIQHFTWRMITDVKVLRKAK